MFNVHKYVLTIAYKHVTMVSTMRSNYEET